MSLRLKVKVSWLSDFSQLHIGAVVFSGLNILVRRVRYAKEQVFKLIFHLADLSVQLFDIGGKLFHLCHDGGGVLAGFFELRDFFGNGVLLVFHLLHLKEQFTAPGVQRQDLRNPVIAFTSSLYGRLYIFIIFSYPSDV